MRPLHSFPTTNMDRNDDPQPAWDLCPSCQQKHAKVQADVDKRRLAGENNVPAFVDKCENECDFGCLDCDCRLELLMDPIDNFTKSQFDHLTIAISPSQMAGTAGTFTFLRELSAMPSISFLQGSVMAFWVAVSTLSIRTAFTSRFMRPTPTRLGLTLLDSSPKYL